MQGEKWKKNEKPKKTHKSKSKRKVSEKWTRQQFEENEKELKRKEN